MSQVPKASNALFRGINTKSDGTGNWAAYRTLNFVDDVANGTASWMPTDLYFIWEQYDIVYTLDAQGATTQGTKTLYGIYGDSVYLDANVSQKMSNNTTNRITVPTRTGYVFKGYYQSPNGGGKRLIDENGGRLVSNFTSTLYAEDATLYAYWEKLPDPYTITLDKEGGTGGSGSVWQRNGYGVYTDSACTKSMTSSSNGITVPTKAGLKFNGYWTSRYGAGHLFIGTNGFKQNAFTSTYFSGHSTIYAEWLGYDVTLDDDGGSKGSGKVYEWYGTGLYLDEHCQAANAMASGRKVAVPARKGHTFGGYYTARGGPASGGTQVIDGDGAVVGSALEALYASPGTWPQAAKTVYAYWTPDVYTVNLDDQGADAGKEGSREVYERYGESVHLSSADATAQPAVNAMTASANAIAVPVRAGWVFAGYFTQKSGGTKYIDESGHITSKFSNTHFEDNMGWLYAHWEASTDPVLVLPVTGGAGVSALGLWGLAAAVFAAAGSALWRALRGGRRAARAERPGR